MGHEELWNVKKERDRIYSLPEMSEEDGMAVADLEVEFAEMDGYTAESRAGELLLGLDIPLEQHEGPMSSLAPGWKLRELLAQFCVPSQTWCCWPTPPASGLLNPSPGGKTYVVTAIGPPPVFPQTVRY